jgi:predicted DNA-binding antitoxin AbrB/MazE fold protein
MSHAIPAIFDSGVFRPLEPVDLATGTRVVVQVETTSFCSVDQIDEQTQLAWGAYLDRMESLPDSSPDDGLTGRDHDRILYGK